MSARNSQSIPAVLVIACTATACVRQLPPRGVPPAEAPRLDPAPAPAPGHGRLVVDVVDGPTPVQRVAMKAQPIDKGSGRTAYEFVETPELLCESTPCVTDVSVGNMLVGFPVRGNGDLEVELVHVAEGTSVYRRALSEYQGSTGMYVPGIVATSVGSASIVTGAALLPMGLSRDSGGLTMAGAISLGAGVALLVGGILATRKGAPTYRAGASNHFVLSPAR